MVFLFLAVLRDEFMKRTVSLNCNGYFLRLYKTGETITGRFLVLYYKKNNIGHNRLGITVSKKVGCAVVRNRVRRLVKENFRLNEEKVAEGFDIIFVSRVRAAQASFHQIEKEMMSHLSSAGLLAGEEME